MLRNLMPKRCLPILLAASTGKGRMVSTVCSQHLEHPAMRKGFAPFNPKVDDTYCGVDPDWFKNSYRIIKPNEIFLELETRDQQKPCSILVFDSGSKYLGVSKITRHVVIDNQVIFSQSTIYVRGVGCLDMGEVRSNMLEVIQNLITCHNSMGFCVGVSRGDPKGEKIQHNQNAHVMEFLVQLAELRDGEGNYVMQNLPMVLVNEFGTSKKADKINDKERELYDYYNKTVQFLYSKFPHVHKVKNLEYDVTKELNKKEASEIANVLVSLGAPKMKLDSDCSKQWIKNVRKEVREALKRSKGQIWVMSGNPHWIERKVREMYFKDNPELEAVFKMMGTWPLVVRCLHLYCLLDLDLEKAERAAFDEAEKKREEEEESKDAPDSNVEEKDDDDTEDDDDDAETKSDSSNRDADKDVTR